MKKIILVSAILCMLLLVSCNTRDYGTQSAQAQYPQQQAVGNGCVVQSPSSNVGDVEIKPYYIKL